jgi:hypothetical protein
MGFDYNISKAIDISLSKNQLGQEVIRIEFRYVTFNLTLDDSERKNDLIELLTGASQRKPVKREEVKMPSFYTGVKK